jgi:hypothetical protein
VTATDLPDRAQKHRSGEHHELPADTISFHVGMRLNDLSLSQAFLGGPGQRDEIAERLAEIDITSLPPSRSLYRALKQVPSSLVPRNLNSGSRRVLSCRVTSHTVPVAVEEVRRELRKGSA